MQKIQTIFKKLLLIIGLIAVLVSVLNQHLAVNHFDTQSKDFAIVVQLDKDNSRDSIDDIAISRVIYHQILKKSSVYHFDSASYQEPTQLVHIRPPVHFI